MQKATLFSHIRVIYFVSGGDGGSSILFHISLHFCIPISPFYPVLLCWWCDDLLLFAMSYILMQYVYNIQYNYIIYRYTCIYAPTHVLFALMWEMLFVFATAACMPNLSGIPHPRKHKAIKMKFNPFPLWLSPCVFPSCISCFSSW